MISIRYYTILNKTNKYIKIIKYRILKIIKYQNIKWISKIIKYNRI